jgi:hypothetical protein
MPGRHDPAVPRSKRMLSDDSSNVLVGDITLPLELIHPFQSTQSCHIAPRGATCSAASMMQSPPGTQVYLAGHGGNEFMKFQDQEELMAADVADAVAQMWGAGRYRELLLIVETCQAATMYTRISAPNVLAMAASLKGNVHGWAGLMAFCQHGACSKCGQQGAGACMAHIGMNPHLSDEFGLPVEITHAMGGVVQGLVLKRQDLYQHPDPLQSRSRRLSGAA